MIQAKSKRQITWADLLQPSRTRSLIAPLQRHPQSPAQVPAQGGCCSPSPCWELGTRGQVPRAGGISASFQGQQTARAATEICSAAGFASPALGLPCRLGPRMVLPALPPQGRTHFAFLLLQRICHLHNLIIAFSAHCHLGAQWQLLSSGERL